MNILGRKSSLPLIIGLSILTFIILSIIGFITYQAYQDYRLRKINEAVQNIPEEALGNKLIATELSTDYDPSENEARFRILNSNRDEGTLELGVIWPQVMVGNEMTSKISCKPWDIKVIDEKQGLDKVVTLNSLMAYINRTPSERLIFNGVCKDSTCTEIVRSCILFISS